MFTRSGVVGGMQLEANVPLLLEADLESEKDALTHLAVINEPTLKQKFESKCVKMRYFL